MVTPTTYKGLTVIEDATGDAGQALTDNFKSIADSLETAAVGGGQATQTINAAGYVLDHDDKGVLNVTNSGAAALTSSAATPIAPGTNTGQELIIRLISGSDIIIQDAGNCTGLTGNCYITSPFGWVKVIWDGTIWNEIDRSSRSDAIGITGLDAKAFQNGIASGARSFASGRGTTSGAVSTGFGSLYTASGQYSFVGGGYWNQATDTNSFAHGTYALASHTNEYAHGLSGGSSAAGEVQYSRFLMTQLTTNGNATLMASPEAFTIAVGSTYGFRITIVARQTAGANHAVWMRECLIDNTGGTTALIGNVVLIGTDTGSNANTPPAAWSIAITANNATDTIDITVRNTGAEAVKWFAVIEAYKVGY